MILCDVQMPGMSVLELCRGLREDGATRQIPIYLLTGVMVGDRSLESLSPYVQGVLSKPPDPAELVAVFDRTCG